MRLNKPITLKLAVAGLLFFSVRSATAQAFCVEQSLEKSPKWISNLEYNAKTEQILIADPKSSELLAYDTKTGKMGEIEVPGDLPPSTITKIQGGFLVKYRDSAAIIGPTYEDKKKTIDIRGAEKGGVSGLGPLYSNWITKGSTFVGFGSVVNYDTAKYRPSRRFGLGFVTGQINADSGEFRNVQLIDPEEENAAYLLGLPFFAANNQGIFFVRMTDSRASIQRVGYTEFGGATLHELSAFPEDFRRIPDLQVSSVGLLSIKERLDKVEKSKMAAGLFGQKNRLYLLVRQPDPSGEGTEWLLYQIDPNEPEPVGVVRLPTKASHLSIAVTPKFWYLFERGAVRAFGDQDIKTVLKIPTAWIESSSESMPKSPVDARLESSRGVRCRRQ